MQQWHLLYTAPRKEPFVNRQLEDRGLEVFFPYLQFDRGYNRGTRLEAFFPQYVFVKVDLTAGDATGLQYLAGVRHVVLFAGQPAVVPEPVVEELRERLDPYAQKVLHKHEWLFEPGQRVVVRKGPFAGMEAVYQKGLSGSQRVQILLQVLGSVRRVELDFGQIKPASSY